MHKSKAWMESTQVGIGAAVGAGGSVGAGVGAGLVFTEITYETDANLVGSDAGGGSSETGRGLLTRLQSSL